VSAGGRRRLVAAVAGVVLLATVVVIVLANPRHRAFYFGDPAAGGVGDAAFPAPPTFELTSRSPFGRPAPVDAAPVADVVAGQRIPRPDAEGRIRVPVVDHVPSRLPAEGVPVGWTLEALEGRGLVELVRDEGRLAMRLRSESASFLLHRDVLLDVREFPYLSWSWKAVRLPHGGDIREPARNDHAAQVYVVFPRWPSPRTTSDVIGYVWDTEAPVDTRLPSPQAANVRFIVVESGTDRVGSWQHQQRNVAEDYQALFGRQPPRVGKVAVMIDADATRSEAEALVGELTFSRTPRRNVETRASMLR
jgi:hypothetical protein